MRENNLHEPFFFIEPTHFDKLSFWVCVVISLPTLYLGYNCYSNFSDDFLGIIWFSVKGLLFLFLLLVIWFGIDDCYWTKRLIVSQDLLIEEKKGLLMTHRQVFNLADILFLVENEKDNKPAFHLQDKKPVLITTANLFDYLHQNCNIPVQRNEILVYYHKNLDENYLPPSE